jgi:Hemerythrin HHE cation binding domain
MVRELQRRTDQLIATVARGAPSEGDVSAVADYFVTTILPHALAEEKTLYAAVAPVERRLIESLKFEHAALRRLGSELPETSEGNERVAIAGALSQLFALHAAKENEFVLPALLQQPDINLAQLLQTMHAEFDSNASAVSSLSVRREATRIGARTATDPGEPMVKISIAELRSIASQVLEGIRIRGFHGATLPGATATAAAEHLNDTILDGRVSHDEPVWLATVLLAIADALAAEDIEGVGAQP